MFRLIGSLNDAHATALDWLGIALSFALGFLLALLTYHCGALVARWFIRQSSPISEQTK